MTYADLGRELELELEAPFLKLLGVRCTRANIEGGEVSLALRTEHENAWQVAHGGVLLTLMDVGMAVAARAADSAGRGVLTLELKNQFLHTAQGNIRVLAQTVHHTASLAFVEAKLWDSNQQLCCMGTATFKYFNKAALEHSLRKKL